MFRDGLVFDAKRLVNNVGVYILQKKRMSGFIISISLLLHYHAAPTHDIFRRSSIVLCCMNILA